MISPIPLSLIHEVQPILREGIITLILHGAEFPLLLELSPGIDYPEVVPRCVEGSEQLDILDASVIYNGRLYREP
jgi:hypothetical protein